MTQENGISKDFGGPLYRKLRAYGESDYYGFHMPGHKRLMGNFENPYRFDITEIDGFDDLHHPEPDGVLTRAQERAARLYGAEETYFLVGGSTAGILSAVSGCTRRGGRVLTARNCHRSVYHAIELGNLKAKYLYPQQISSLGINGAICPEDVEKMLEEERRPGGEDGPVQAVIITSPTYDGVCSDVKTIAEICHRYGIPLIVDQAHGAHFPFSDYFPEDAVSAGADVVIHSVHKTLPALTQTALLHIQGKLADRERIRHYLSVYQSSSPSYVLMASIDACTDLLERKSGELFAEHVRLLSAFRESCRDLKILYLAGDDMAAETPADGACDFDRSKLLVSARRAGLSGSRLSGLLLERWHLQMEMSGPDYVVGIASIADTKEGFDRLSAALHELDCELAERPDPADSRDAGENGGLAGRPQPGWGCPSEHKGAFEYEEPAELPRLPAPLTAGEAEERKREVCPVSDCTGRLAADYIYLYPPGIPLIVPGEEITAGAVRRIRQWQKAGFAVHGLAAGDGMPVLRI